MAKTFIERLEEKYILVPYTECWIWMGAMNKEGYGSVRGPDGISHPAHRMSYEYYVGPIPDGLVLDHLCRMPSCVNPAHLEPVTRLENYRRGDGPASHSYNYQMRKRYCKYGHPLSGDNLYVRPDGKGGDCNICRAARNRKALPRRNATKRWNRILDRVIPC